MKLENVTIYSMKVGNGHNKDSSRVNEMYAWELKCLEVDVHIIYDPAFHSYECTPK